MVLSLNFLFNFLNFSHTNFRKALFKLLVFNILVSAVTKIEYFPFHTSSFCSLSASKTNFSLLRSVFNNVLVMLHHLVPAFTKSTTDVCILIIFTHTDLHSAVNVPLRSNKKIIF